MAQVLKRAVITVVDGVSSIFFNNAQSRIRRTRILDDTEAIRVDWQIVGMDLYDAMKHQKEELDHVTAKEQEKETVEL